MYLTSIREGADLWHVICDAELTLDHGFRLYCYVVRTRDSPVVVQDIYSTALVLTAQGRDAGRSNYIFVLDYRRNVVETLISSSLGANIAAPVDLAAYWCVFCHAFICFSLNYFR